MAEPAFTPEEVGPTEDGTRLRVEWKDGHVSTYAPRRLRLACPCAGCVDEMTGERMLTPGMVPDGVHPREIRYVGRYALRFFWSDGHDTGLYSYEYLRRLCGCEGCRNTGEDPDPGEAR